MSRANEARIAHWKQHVDQWQSSGLSGAAYCQQHELTYHCFIYWRSKFSSGEAKHPTEARPDGREPSAFVAIRSQPFSGLAESPDTDSLHLGLPNGLEIRNIYASNLGNVRLLLECLS